MTSEGAAPTSDGTAPWRILLVEDDDLMRERLAQILSSWERAQLVAACSTLAEAMRAVDAQPIDLLVSDLRLPDGHGIEVIRRCRRTWPQSEAMVISVLADERSVLDAIEAGAAGYLLKDAYATDLIDAITDLMSGRSPISSTIARVLVRRLSAQESRAGAVAVAGGPSLTPRETEILLAISKGFTYDEIADRLGLSRQTVPVHIRNIYRKLSVNNRSEAVYEARQMGLLSP